MKIKGMREALDAIAKLQDKIQEKIDSIEWKDGDTDRDSKRDECYNEAWDCTERAIEQLSEIRELSLEDF